MTCKALIKDPQSWDHIPQKTRTVQTVNVMIRKKNAVINMDAQSPPRMAHTCQPPFINHRRNGQPFSVIPAYYLQLFQGTEFLKVSGDNDNVASCVNPAIRSGSTLTSIAGLYVCADGCKAMPNLLQQQHERQFFSTGLATQTDDYAFAFYSHPTEVTHFQSLRPLSRGSSVK